MYKEKRTTDAKMSYAYAYDATVSTPQGISSKMSKHASSYGLRECVVTLPLFVSGLTSKGTFGLFVDSLIRGGHRDIMIFYPSKFGCSPDMEKGQELRSLGVELTCYDSGEVLGTTGKNKVDTTSSPSKSSSSSRPSAKNEVAIEKTPKEKKRYRRRKGPKKIDDPAREKIAKEAVTKEKVPRISRYTDEEYNALLLEVEESEYINPEWPSFLIRLFMNTKRKEAIDACRKGRDVKFEEFIAFLVTQNVFSPDTNDVGKERIAAKTIKTFGGRPKYEKEAVSESLPESLPKSTLETPEKEEPASVTRTEETLPEDTIC